MTEWMDFAVETDRNAELLQKFLQSIRVLRRNPSNEMRDIDWLLPAKQEIGERIMKYWVTEINNPKLFEKRQNLHILWKWNGIS